MKRILLLALLLFPLAVAGQPANPSIVMVSTDPSGSCKAGLPWRYSLSDGTGWYCGSVSGGTGTWTEIGSSGGSGTVNPGLAGEMAFYPADGSAVSGSQFFYDPTGAAELWCASLPCLYNIDGLGNNVVITSEAIYVVDANGNGTVINPDTVDVNDNSSSAYAAIDNTGSLTLGGSSTGSAAIGVAADAGSPNGILLPTATALPGQSLVSDGGNPQQLSWGGHGYLNFSTGQITAIVSNGQYNPQLIVATETLQNITATADVFTCSGNPTITLEDCGTSAGTCSSPSALGSVTVTAANTITAGSVTSATLTSGHYVEWKTTGGTCTALNLSGSAAY